MSRRKPDPPPAMRASYVLAGMALWLLAILSYFAEGALLARPDVLAQAMRPGAVPCRLLR